MKGVTVVDHPLVQHKLTIMRDKVSVAFCAKSRCCSATKSRAISN
jgi:hypothetical protein